jgi:hypothetical protein
MEPFMAFADPQSVTVGSAQSLPRTGSSLESGHFMSGDQAFSMEVNQQYKTRTRRQARLNQQKIVTDPLFSTQNKRVSASVYLVVDQPQSGFSPTELKDLVKGLLGNLTASSDANLVKLLGGES